MNERGLALAAMFQCAGLVDDLAYRRPVHESDLACVLQGLFVFDPPEARAVFNPACLGTGRQVARECLDQSKRLHLIGYLGNMTALQARLNNRPASSEALRTGLQQLQATQNGRPLTQLDVLETMARLYSEHISPMSPRIMVQGQPQALRNARTVAAIRSLLLAGIRAARLWTQTGGSRWHLVFRRKKLLSDL